jgi:hypothetical protein
LGAEIKEEHLPDFKGDDSDWCDLIGAKVKLILIGQTLYVILLFFLLFFLCLYLLFFLSAAVREETSTASALARLQCRCH